MRNVGKVIVRAISPRWGEAVCTVSGAVGAGALLSTWGGPQPPTVTTPTRQPRNINRALAFHQEWTGPSRARIDLIYTFSGSPSAASESSGWRDAERLCARACTRLKSAGSTR